ncbi:MAG: hypothetical protein COA99_13200 [Moraxellaceae bacterium]|nr:MAG: hypothetical protein COA99_13200 [Moraxellaceae bacterium]
MKNICLIILILGSSFCFAKTDAIDVHLVYSGFDFLIPSGQDAVGANGGDNNFLVFRYGKEKGTEYLAFTDISNDEGYGCKSSEFYADLFEIRENSKCNKNELVTFKESLIENSESGSWKGKNTISYYSISEPQSLVFLVYKDKVIKVDTDFLTKKELKKIFEKVID